MSALDKAIEHVGSPKLLAEKLGVTPMAISQWKKRGIPLKRAKEIEEATDSAVTRKELCPELFG